jgi:hypothetical protein
MGRETLEPQELAEADCAERRSSRLETVAAVLDRRGLWRAGMAIGAIGVLALADGFLGIV